MSGSYRCQAETPSDPPTKAQGYPPLLSSRDNSPLHRSNVDVTVIGIESIRVLDKSMKIGRAGHVEVEVGIYY